MHDFVVSTSEKSHGLASNSRTARFPLLAQVNLLLSITAMNHWQTRHGSPLEDFS